MAGSVDWRLVLEFFKVAAPPIGAVVIAAIGFKSYRAQKRFDHRTGWYHSLHSQLGKVASLFRWAGAAHAAGNKDHASRRMTEALAASLALSERMSEGFLFGLEADIVVLRRLGLTMEEIHREVEAKVCVSEAIGRRASEACLSAANDLAVGYRKELGLPPVNYDNIERQLTK